MRAHCTRTHATFARTLHIITTRGASGQEGGHVCTVSRRVAVGAAGVAAVVDGGGINWLRRTQTRPRYICVYCWKVRYPPDGREQCHCRFRFVTTCVLARLGRPHRGCPPLHPSSFGWGKHRVQGTIRSVWLPSSGLPCLLKRGKPPYTCGLPRPLAAILQLIEAVLAVATLGCRSGTQSAGCICRRDALKCFTCTAQARLDGAACEFESSSYSLT